MAVELRELGGYHMQEARLSRATLLSTLATSGEVSKIDRQTGEGQWGLRGVQPRGKVWNYCYTEGIGTSAVVRGVRLTE